MSSSDKRPTDDRSMRDWVIQAGLEILDRDGLELGPHSLSYAKVFAYLEQEYSTRVTRGSVHERIWATHEDFRLDVMAEVVKHLPNQPPNLVPQRLDRLGLHNLPPDERVDLFCRSGFIKSVNENFQSSAFQQTQVAKAVSIRIKEPLGMELLQTAFNREAQRASAAHRQQFSILLADLGLKPRSDLGLTPDQVIDLSGTLRNILFTGGLLNHNLGKMDLSDAVRFRSIEPDDANPWLISAIGLRSIVGYLFEKDSSVGAQQDPSETSAPPLMNPPSTPTVYASSTEIGARRTRQQLRQLLLAAGAEMLLRDGLVLSPESLTYAKVFAHLAANHNIELSQGSVHKRLWNSLEEFQLDVLVEGTRDSPLSKVLAAEPLAGSPSPVFGPDDNVHNEQTILNYVRLGVDFVIGNAASSPNIQRQMLTKASLLAKSDSPRAKVLRSAISQADHIRHDAYKQLVKARVSDCGFEVRPEVDVSEDAALDIFVSLTIASTAGSIFDQLAGIETAGQTISLPRVSDNTQRDDWSPAAIASAAYFKYLFVQTVD